jgi:hypothetical protein
LTFKHEKPQLVEFSANSTNVICIVHLKIGRESNKTMKNKILTLSIIILLMLTTIYVTSTANVKAQVGSGQWITKYRIEDAITGDLILSKDLTTGATSGNGQISDGANLKVTVTINVATSNPSSSLTLSTAMAHSSTLDHYWAHDASDGYSLGGYDPNAASFSFSQTAGTLTISCYGVASGTVATTVGGITLHKAVPISLISLTDPSGALLDEINTNITDASINEFNTKLQGAQSTLAGLSGVDPSYTELYQNVITEAQNVANQGLTDNAISMLDSLNVSSAPASGTLQILFIPLIAVFAVLAGIFGFMFMRSRSKVSYFQLVVEDQIKDLEGLTLRASKIDRTMASNLDGIKDRLKRLVGM